MYWNIIDKERYKLLREITENVSLQDYYMIGGTALSLQMGLRQSFDFDFCVLTQFNNEILLEDLRKVGELVVKQNQKGTCDVVLNGVQVSFFYYPNEVINDFVKVKEMPKLKIASVLDIAAMKVVAIGGRGAKKDFFDLYYLINEKGISTLELTNALIRKCGENVNYANIIMGLSYFEDAEQELLPKIFVEYDWDKIKRFFINFQTKLQNSFEKLRIIMKKTHIEQNVQSEFFYANRLEKPLQTAKC